ncbi:hypothetical protein GGS23DRAFT_544176 [Durotheca rogersii]|uniref:uncharacterized protein n=1 Tax=Durotheca rogersii TaxID=419775 RepID=UPI00221EC7E7|nr:uncharacterized protein GGS23DRAFT_544176 [Durotheca rogersii]KAI5868132.1 hypothetical protein GGS23DRAFT_544176 [Durotheca rogersii]
MSRYPLEPGRRWTQDRRYGQSIGLATFEEDGNFKARKRPRASMVRRELDNLEDEPSASSSATRRGITIGDEKAVWAFYEERFKSCQQTACKLIAKAWVKAVEPKKQSTHPYTGSDEKAPDWWPKPWGPNKEHKVRHKEPDHLLKRERVHLLNHILRMIVEPSHSQHPTLQKLFLNVSKLEEITNEALSAFFADKDNPSNLLKKPYLKEIFKVAKAEERFKDGQIDGSTVVHVMANDRVGQSYVSDAEDVSPGRDDGEHNPTPGSSSVSPSRPNMPPPQMALVGQQAHSAEQSPAMQMSSDAFGEMQGRGTAYPQPVLGQEMVTAERSAFTVEGASLSGQAPALHPTPGLGIHEMYASPHESSRRSSMFASPSEYTSPATPNMYPQWQGQGVSAPPSGSSIYSFPQPQPQPAGAQHHHHHNHQQPPPPPPSFVAHTGVAIAHSQSYGSPSFDGLPRAAHDAQQHSAGLYRPAPLGQASLPHPGYQNYLSPHESGPISASSIKPDPLPRHPAH